MFSFNTFKPQTAENPAIVLTSPRSPQDRNKPLHSGTCGLEGLIISLGGHVFLKDAPLITNFRQSVRITELGMTNAGLLAIEEKNPEKTFLLWGTSAEDFDKLQRHILETCEDIPADNILERNYLRAVNKSFISEHGELDESDFEKISQARTTMGLARMPFGKTPIPLPGDTVTGSYYHGKYPFNSGVIVSQDYLGEGSTVQFCAQPMAPYLTPQSGHVNPCGGPFFHVSTRHLVHTGQGERFFWLFGHDGPCGNGGVYFPVMVNRWQLLPEANI